MRATGSCSTWFSDQARRDGFGVKGPFGEMHGREEHGNMGEMRSLKVKRGLDRVALRGLIRACWEAGTDGVLSAPCVSWQQHVLSTLAHTHSSPSTASDYRESNTFSTEPEFGFRCKHSTYDAPKNRSPRALSLQLSASTTPQPLFYRS